MKSCLILELLGKLARSSLYKSCLFCLKLQQWTVVTESQNFMDTWVTISERKKVIEKNPIGLDPEATRKTFPIRLLPKLQNLGPNFSFVHLYSKFGKFLNGQCNMSGRKRQYSFKKSQIVKAYSYSKKFTAFSYQYQGTFPKFY